MCKKKHPARPQLSAADLLNKSCAGHDLDSASRALSQSGAGASCALTVRPTGTSRYPARNSESCCCGGSPLAPKRCRCGRHLDNLGDHRSARAQVGVLAYRYRGRWSAPRRASAGRQAPGSPQASLCEDSTLMSPPPTAGGSRSSPAAFRSGGGAQNRSRRDVGQPQPARRLRTTRCRGEASAGSLASQSAQVPHVP